MIRALAYATMYPGDVYRWSDAQGVHVLTRFLGGKVGVVSPKEGGPG